MTVSASGHNGPIRRVRAKEGADQIIQILQEDGVVVIENFCPPDIIGQLNDEVEPYIARYGENLPQVFANRHGPHCKRINNLVAKSKTVREHLLNNPLIHDICRQVYIEQQRVDYWMSSAMLLEHSPGGKPGAYHRDQNFFPLSKMLGPKGPLVLMNLFVALTDIREENGGTRVIRGSHTWLDFEDHGTPDMSVPMVLKPGDACLLGGKTAHGSGENSTVDSFRRMLIMGFQAGYLTPYESTCLHVSREIVDSLTPLARRMIGWGSPTIDSTPTWTVDCNDVGLWWEQKRKGDQRRVSDQ